MSIHDNWQHDNDTTPQPPAPAAAPVRSPRGPLWVGVAAVAVATGVASCLLTLWAVKPTNPADSAGQGVGGTVSVPIGSDTGWTSVATKVRPSVVSVDVETAGGGDEGSGVIWDTAGDVVTNDHVVAEAGRGATVHVTLWDQRRYPAAVVGVDPSTDLAVLQINHAPGSLTPIDEAHSQVHVGDAVMAVGNPLGLSGTVTSGIVSAIDRPVMTNDSKSSGGQPVVADAIQTSAAINPGNSGGALVNDHGTLIGINSAIASLSHSSQGQSGNIGIGFAIPANEVGIIVPQLISSGAAQHAFLGIGTKDAAVQHAGYESMGAGVTTVVPSGPAAPALQPGDVITAIDGAPVSGSESLLGRVRELPVGQAVMVSFVRDGRSASARVVLGQAPEAGR